MDINKADLIEPGNQTFIHRIHLGIGCRAVEHAIGRDTHADMFSPDGGCCRLGHFHCKTDAVLDAAAPAIGALVGCGIEELVYQVAVRCVQFDAVKAGLDRAFRARCVFCDG